MYVRIHLLQSGGDPPGKIEDLSKTLLVQVFGDAETPSTAFAYHDAVPMPVDFRDTTG